MKTNKFLVIAALIAHVLITACGTSGGSAADKPVTTTVFGFREPLRRVVYHGYKGTYQWLDNSI